MFYFFYCLFLHWYYFSRTHLSTSCCFLFSVINMNMVFPSSIIQSKLSIAMAMCGDGNVCVFVCYVVYVVCASEWCVYQDETRGEFQPWLRANGEACAFQPWLTANGAACAFQPWLIATGAAMVLTTGTDEMICLWTGVMTGVTIDPWEWTTLDDWWDTADGTLWMIWPVTAGWTTVDTIGWWEMTCLATIGWWAIIPELIIPEWPHGLDKPNGLDKANGLSPKPRPDGAAAATARKADKTTWKRNWKMVKTQN